ncbi:MAG: hypothetical protein Q8R29_02625 [bacterium]|nr:hypothetical protein [bacterium]
MKKVGIGLIAIPYFVGVVLTALIYLIFYACLYKSDDTRNQIRYNEAVFLSASGAEKNASGSDLLIEATRIGRILKSKHEQGIDFQELTARVKDYNVLNYIKEKKDEVTRVFKRSLSLNNLSKPMPAEMDTALALISIAESASWKNFMDSAENKEILRGVLEGKIQPPDLSKKYNRGFFILEYWIMLVIIQCGGVLVYIIDFYTGNINDKKIKDIYGYWYNLDWINPLIWIMILPSGIPFLLASFIGKICSRSSGKKDANKIDFAVSSDNGAQEDSNALLEKLRESIGGTHVKKNG